MAKIEMTYSIAMAAAQDAGNRSMREGRHTKWAVKDWNVACETFERLYDMPSHELSKKSATSTTSAKEGQGNDSCRNNNRV